ncbi:Delta(7)-sterol 5(6)-desaturase [Candida viswanathii]|uniref:Delta(7)-sterol 5(6)-desaturase n=1 Tax=Candida viswanathii TaxID=5486 RepID=A0A367Y657_9ASCO|nr:Delta(7)-sterol 5(6)-desaturase [Candida viswanathii]
MDIVLEICDYFLFDRVYAGVFPKDGAAHEYIKSSPIIQALSNISLPKSQIVDSFSTNSTMLASSAASNFSLASVTPSDIPKYIFSKIVNYQDQSEIYGLAPKLLPAGNYFDASFLGRANIFREFLSLFIVTTIFGWALYFLVASVSYVFVFDRNIFNHPRYLKNQMSLEIGLATRAIPVMVLLTCPFFMLELRGFSFLYFNIDESTGGYKALLWQVPKFILFTDCGIYFLHRWLHWPSVYKALHKPHHKWIVCTPFASHAFHPVDGFVQSLPYHIYPLFFPLHKVLYLGLFTFVNFWTVMIHDGNYWSNDPVVNGTACHTVHHLYFNYNYGQFTTLWDRLGRSYRRPDDSLFVREQAKEQEKKVWKEQTKEMEDIRGALEGKVDDREYISED